MGFLRGFTRRVLLIRRHAPLRIFKKASRRNGGGKHQFPEQQMHLPFYLLSCPTLIIQTPATARTCASTPLNTSPVPPEITKEDTVLKYLMQVLLLLPPRQSDRKGQGALVGLPEKSWLNWEKQWRKTSAPSHLRNPAVQPKGTQCE